MEATEAVFTRFKALVDADTGDGGLSNATGNQYVRGGVIDARDRRDAGTFNRPALVVAVAPDEMGHEASGRSFEAVIRVRIDTDRDRGRAEQDAIADRLVTVTNGVALGAGSSGWTFSTMTYLRTVNVINDKMLRTVVELHVIATK